MTLALDIVIALLLVATIIFAAILNTRLNALRWNKSQLGRLITSFNEATLRAESGIPKLRKTAEEAGQSLHEQVERVQTLRDNLAFLIEWADSMAAQLEGTVRSARGEMRGHRGLRRAVLPTTESQRRRIWKPSSTTNVRWRNTNCCAPFNPPGEGRRKSMKTERIRNEE